MAAPCTHLTYVHSEHFDPVACDPIDILAGALACAFLQFQGPGNRKGLYFLRCKLEHKAFSGIREA